MKNELRVGNIIRLTSLSGINAMVAGITDEKLYYQPRLFLDNQKPLKAMWGYVKGIPLTEEWLKRFDDLEPCFFSNEYYFYFDDKTLTVSIYEGEVTVSVQDDIDENILYFNCIEFVHDFQNLIHSVSKYELKIKR